MKRGFLKRYFAVVGLIFVVLAGVGVMTKPSLESMKRSVEQELTRHTQTRLEAGQPAPASVDRASYDLLIAVSHQARADDALFYCIGGFFITFCQSPD